MNKIATVKIVMAIFLLVIGVWTWSFLPFFVILLLVDSFRQTSYLSVIWSFMKQRTGRHMRTVEWFFALAIAAWLIFFVQHNFIGVYTFHTSSMHGTLDSGDVLLVNKVKHGARKNANNIPWFHRTKGLSTIKYEDVVVFNFPEGDTLLKKRPTESYYYLQRRYGSEEVNNNQKSLSNFEYRKVVDRPRFVKRVYGLPGDSISIVNGQFFANGNIIPYPEFSVARYKLNDDRRKRLNREGVVPYNELTTSEGLIWELYEKDVQKVRSLGLPIEEDCLPKNYPDPLVFPFNHYLLWNMHNMGPLYVPKKGDEIKLSRENMIRYRRCIETFEENKVEQKGDSVFINGTIAQTYKFKMDYYWVMGDNRPHSFDSRFWGYVPDNHIIGKVDRVLVSRSLQEKGWFKPNRFWKKVK